jgi:hypothetical protein
MEHPSPIQAPEPATEDFDRSRPPCEAGRRDRSLKSIVETTVSQVFRIELAAIQASSRGLANVALARQTAMYLTHVVCGMPLTDVGRVFNRDRTTVRHACTVIEDRRDDASFDRTICLLEEIVARMTRVSGLAIGREADRHDY